MKKMEMRGGWGAIISFFLWSLYVAFIFFILTVLSCGNQHFIWFRMLTPVSESKHNLKFFKNTFLIFTGRFFSLERCIIYLKPLTTSIQYRWPHPLCIIFIWQVAWVGRKIPLKMYPESNCRTVRISIEFFWIFGNGSFWN